MVDFKAKLVEQEWKKLGIQMVHLIDESIYMKADKYVCLHCNEESHVVVGGEKPMFEIHHEDCEVGKAQELIAKIRKRVKAGK